MFLFVFPGDSAGFWSCLTGAVNPFMARLGTRQFHQERRNLLPGLQRSLDPPSCKRAQESAADSLEDHHWI